MKQLILLVVIIAVGFSLYYPKKENAIIEQTESHSPLKVVSLSQETKQISVEKIKQTLQEIPKKEQETSLDKEFQKTDHAPKVVLEWSTDIAEVMLDALKDEKKSEETFSFLKKCALDNTAAMPYKAICAVNAKRLAQKFPQRYENEYSELKNNLPEKILSFLAQTES